MNLVFFKYKEAYQQYENQLFYVCYKKRQKERERENSVTYLS
jgi:hypothetical protein